VSTTNTMIMGLLLNVTWIFLSVDLFHCPRVLADLQGCGLKES
jgi:hypothetical protein